MEIKEKFINSVGFRLSCYFYGGGGPNSQNIYDPEYADRSSTKINTLLEETGNDGCMSFAIMAVCIDDFIKRNKSALEGSIERLDPDYQRLDLMQRESIMKSTLASYIPHISGMIAGLTKENVAGIVEANKLTTKNVYMGWPGQEESVGSPEKYLSKDKDVRDSFAYKMKRDAPQPDATKEGPETTPKPQR